MKEIYFIKEFNSNRYLDNDNQFKDTNFRLFYSEEEALNYFNYLVNTHEVIEIVKTYQIDF